MSSNQTGMFDSVPAGENPYKVDSKLIKTRGKLLQRYLKDEQKELQALYALQALLVQLEQPASEWLLQPRVMGNSQELKLKLTPPPQVCCASSSTASTTRT